MEDYYFGAKHLHKTFTIGKRAKTAIAFWQASSQNMLTIQRCSNDIYLYHSTLMGTTLDFSSKTNYA